MKNVFHQPPQHAQSGDSICMKKQVFAQSHEVDEEGGRESLWEYKNELKLQSFFKIRCYSTVMQSTSRLTGWGSTRESVSCLFPFAHRHSLVSNGLVALKCNLKR